MKPIPLFPITFLFILILSGMASATTTFTTILNMTFNTQDGVYNSTFAEDLSGYGNNGTVVGAVNDSFNGIYRGRYDFDGNNKYINLTDKAIWDELNSTKDFSIEFWIYPHERQTERFIFFKNTDWAIELFQGKIRFIERQTSIENVSTPTNSISLNSWQHIVVAFNASRADRFRIYINAINQTLSTDNGFQWDSNDGDLLISRNSATSALNASLDEILIYNISLTQEQVTDLYDDFIFGNFFVNESGGDDTNKGDTWETAIRTNTKLNTLSLPFGANVSFTGKFRLPDVGYLTLTDGVNYRCYDASFLASYNGSRVDCWNTTGGNLWRWNCSALTEQIGNIIVNDENETLVRNKSTELPLSKQGQYFYNYSQDTVYIYSASNPATYYKNIEMAEYKTPFIIQAKNNILIDGCEILYSARGAVGQNEAATAVRNITVTNNNVRFIGGGYLNDDEDDRTGNALSFSNNIANVLAYRNNITEVWDSCLAITDFTGSGAIDNINFSHNIVRKCGLTGVELFSTDYTITNVTVEHNTILETGWGFSGRADYIGEHGQGDNRGRAFRWTRAPTSSKNITVRNNLIYNTSYIYILFNESSGWTGEKPIWDNNLYFGKSGLQTTYFSSWSGTLYSTFAQHKTASGIDANSVEADPLFIPGTYQPAFNSPAKFAEDYAGAIKPQTDAEPPSYTIIPNNATPEYLTNISETFAANTVVNFSTNNTDGFYMNMTTGVLSNNKTLAVGIYYHNITITAGTLSESVMWFVNVTKNTGSCNILFSETSPLSKGLTFFAYADCTSSFNLFRETTLITNNSLQELTPGTYVFYLNRTDRVNYSNIYDTASFIIQENTAEYDNTIDNSTEGLSNFVRIFSLVAGIIVVIVVLNGLINQQLDEEQILQIMFSVLFAAIGLAILLGLLNSFR